MQIIHDISEVPSFSDEDAEHGYWATHALSEELVDRAEPVPDGWLPPPRAHSGSVRIQLDDEMVPRIRRLALKKGMGLRETLRDLVITGLATEEQRAGLHDSDNV
ncbi:MAG: hypothetical protein HYX51_05340 [Chloroflexi bacterium]|nr:hypothetical protein [Chloroflexota bacterium]